MNEIGKFFKAARLFSSEDNIPWSDSGIIAGCERDASEAATEEQKMESLMRLSWALVHSKEPTDIRRGIAMLEASLNSSTSPLQAREKFYLLAVGHYRNGDYTQSRLLIDQCLEVQPDWGQARSLKKAIEKKITKDGLIGMGIATTAMGLLIGGVAAVVARK